MSKEDETLKGWSAGDLEGIASMGRTSEQVQVTVRSGRKG